MPEPGLGHPEAPRQAAIQFDASLPVLPFVAKPAVAVLLCGLLCWQWPHWRDGLTGALPAGDDRLSQSWPFLLLMLSLTLLVIRLAQSYAQFRLGHRPPRLVRQIITLLAVTVAAGVCAASLWDIPLGSLMTTSGLLVAVIGIALKNMISDLFNGISMPVRIGDWVDVGGERGRVVEISWRATRLVNNDRVSMVIPNTLFITHTIRNYTSEAGYFVDRVRLTLPTSVTAYQAERILVGCAHQIDAIAVLPRRPEARILGFNNSGVEWELLYPVTDAGQAPQLRHRVQRALMRDLYFSGIDLPVAQVEVHHTPLPATRPQRQEVAFLTLIDLFGTMTEDELLLVSERMRQRLLRAGQPVVIQGDQGDSLFILQEGLMSASIRTEAGSAEVGKIRPGQFFGEMSLLTGAARSATVTPLVDSKVFEIDRDILAPILLDRPEIAALMSRVLADRQLANAPKLETAAQMSDAQDSLAQQILGHIVAFFRLPTRQRYSSV